MIKTLPFALTAALTLGAHAQPAASADATTWGLGVGVAAERKPYRDFDDEARALPLLMLENRWVSVLGPRADLKLYTNETVSLRLRVAYHFDGYEADDSPYLQGMAERKASLWAGGAVTVRTSLGLLSAEVLGDASNKSKGGRVKLGIERDFTTGDFTFTPHASAHWLDRKFVTYYYGVTAAEAAAGRAAYEGKSTANLELGLRVAYAVTPRQSLQADVSTTRLGAGIKDSPLVERATQTGLRVGYLYRF